ncbi:LGFP repeat-containing protein [Agromyces sp. ZXT2-3]|uniref:LGFP repeat-containing protein n=1 Tax=Agromyces sp. ZXT2-3 TaxID=3461152 RepID=UPI004055038B
MSQIERKYAEAGIPDRVGRPTGIETDAPDGGRMRLFEHGLILWHPMAGAHEVHGAIAAEYRLAGGPSGTLGYPTSDEMPIGGRRGGAYHDFMDGQVYWRSDLGAHAISGGIYEKFALQSWLAGPGYPTARALVGTDGSVRQSFERATLTWHIEDGAGLIPQRGPMTWFLRVLPVAFPDVPAPAGLSRELLVDYFFGTGIDLRMPGGGRVRESVSEFFARLSGGRVRLEGVVEEWFESDRECHQMAHWIDGGKWPEGDPGHAGEFAKAMSHAGIGDRASFRVGDRTPDGIYFLHTDMLASGGTTRTLEGIRSKLLEHRRGDLWRSGWDEFADLPFCSSSATRQQAQNIDPATSRFARRPRPEELEYAPQSTIRHELMHMVGPFPGDIYGIPWRFDSTWHEVMTTIIRSDGPVGTSSFARERLCFMAPTTAARRTHPALRLPELETNHSATRFPNGPQGDPEFLVLENRQRHDYAKSESPRLPNGIFAYAIDPRMREFVPTKGGAKRVAGRLIHRSDQWDSAFGTDGGGTRIAEERHAGRTTLNHAGEYWWSFTGMSVDPAGDAVVDAAYRADDLLARHAGASWSDHTGRLVIVDEPRPSGAVVLMSTNPVSTAMPGVRFRRALALQPPWVPDGAVKGVFEVRVPEHGGRLYLSGAFAEGASGSDGVQLSVAFAGPFDPMSARVPVELGHVHVSPDRPHGTLVVDLARYAGRRVKLSVRVDALASSGRDWFYLTEATVVPTARVFVDLLARLDEAQFRVGPDQRSITLGDASGHRGSVRRDAQMELQDGRTYAGPSLNLHPQWTSMGWVDAEWPVTFPTSYSVLRLLGGLHAARRVVDHGIELAVAFERNRESVMLLERARIRREPALGHRGRLRNPLLTTALAIPQHLRGTTGTLRISVNANGSSSQDWFQLVSARLTAA